MIILSHLMLFCPDRRSITNLEWIAVGFANRDRHVGEAVSQSLGEAGKHRSFAGPVPQYDRVEAHSLDGQSVVMPNLAGDQTVRGAQPQTERERTGGAHTDRHAPDIGGGVAHNLHCLGHHLLS